ncbi:MAG: 4Fe-4S dicluster domain-containing protein [Rhizobiaceae bacterium]|nr:4Fe-4S dicluster domain-containing protein [Rhizobiaceae bacterium]
MPFLAADDQPRQTALSALSALSAFAVSEPPVVTLSSDGVVLVHGPSEAAIAAGIALSDRLDVTVIVSGGGDVDIPEGLAFPVVHGRIVSASGHFGAYECVVDGFAETRGGPVRDGAVSRCDLIIDLSNAPALFPAFEARDGYFKIDPTDGAALARALEEAGDLVGEFDKPKYVAFRPELCAHSRSSIKGCTRCLDACAMEAIRPLGDVVSIDAMVCAGCGNCAAVCPTGAASYTVPSIDEQLGRLRAMILAYRAAGGADAVVLIHDVSVGRPLIEAIGAALPATVLPFEVNEIKQVGIEVFAAALAYGVSGVRLLTRKAPKNGIATLAGTVGLATAFAEALGYGTGACAIVQADMPDDLLAALVALPRGTPSPNPSSFAPVGAKRGLLEFSLRTLHEVAPAPVALVPLPAGAPFGAVLVDTAGCTLCHSCVTACPTGALSAGEDRPMLRFAENACVQCGLCEATCPENVITLRPQLDFAAWNAPRVTLKEEEPYPCVRCAKPFGTRSTIERVIAKLEGSHWMFTGENARRLDAIRMCETCRVEAALNEGFDPYAGAARPRPRTAADYAAADDEA